MIFLQVFLLFHSSIFTYFYCYATLVGTAYGFTKFELQIDVSGEEDVKVEYEVKTNKIEVEYIKQSSQN